MTKPLSPGKQAEAKVLAVLQKQSDDFSYLSFNMIGALTDLDRRTVRRACRLLARKGLARYGRGLWTEDGEPAGSGYAAVPNSESVSPSLTEPSGVPVSAAKPKVAPVPSGAARGTHEEAKT